MFRRYGLTMLERCSRAARANVVVKFDNSKNITLDADNVPDATKRFRRQIKDLGIGREECDYINDDLLPSVPAWRHRRRSFVALTPRAEVVFKLAQR